MDDSLFRLAWALPLVLLIGVAAMLGLKRLGLGQVAVLPVVEPVVVSKKTLSEHTQVYVLEHGRERYLVFESTASLNVQALPTANMATSGAAAPMTLQGWRNGRRVS